MLAHQRLVSSSLLALAIVGTACNSVFDIQKGQPRAQCADLLTIDDMEDGDGEVCESDGRHGYWYTVGDGTSTDLTAGSTSDFKPALIPGGRAGSRYASRLTGSGFTDFGAILGFSFKQEGLGTAVYDAATTGGITFWMKSNAPVSVNFLIPETVLPANGGLCDESADDPNCNSHFAFKITAPSSDWVKYDVPYGALTQQFGGTATWNTQRLLGVQFLIDPGQAFDVWIDDVAFYHCGMPSCVPTCTDPAFPVSCPRGPSFPAACRPEGTDCAKARTWCSVSSIIDDMEDGDARVCPSDGRGGGWFTASDDTSTDLSPSKDFLQTPIPGGRDDSSYAARLTGSGFTAWGAQMGLGLKSGGLAYDASESGGIRFWMKSDTPVRIGVSTTETVAPDRASAGTCVDHEGQWNCDNGFEFPISSGGSDWQRYDVPFAALSQGGRSDADSNLNWGNAKFSAAALLGIHFTAPVSEPPGAAFEIWVDDLQFYSCSGNRCVPTCEDPKLPVPCPASAAGPAGCWREGTDCARLLNAGLYAVWGSGPEDAWAVGNDLANGSGVIRHWNGSDWSSIETDDATPLWAVGGSAADAVWAIGDHGNIFRWDGAVWSASNIGTNVSLNAVWASSEVDVWAVVDPNVARHWNGTKWTPFRLPAEGSFWALWGSGSDDVWAAGAAGSLAHWDGFAWSASPSGTEATLNKVWGSGPSDVWAVGDAGTLIHWDGKAWSAVSQLVPTALYSVWGSASDDVWAVGDGGVVLHWNGEVWSVVPSPVPVDLFDVWGSGADDVWVVGDAGTTIHWDGGSWQDVRP